MGKILNTTLISSIILFLSYAILNINNLIENKEELRETSLTNKNFEEISGNSTIEDLIPINNKFLIGTGFSLKNVLSNKTYLVKEIPNDNLYLFEIKAKILNILNINDFPQEIPFHPHGMDILKQNEREYLLYIINHAVNYNFEGQERIEIIQINYNIDLNKISAFYFKSIILSDNYLCTLNSLAVINKNLFYFTTSKSFPYPKSNLQLTNIFQKIKFKIYDYLSTLLLIINYKNCFVYSYNGIITKIDGSQSLFNNGITFDKKRNLLYVLRTIEKDMQIFQLNQIENNKANLIKSISISFAGDNIYYDELTDKINIAFTGNYKDNKLIKNSIKKYGIIKNIEIYNGFLELSPENDYEDSDLIIFKNKFYGTSTSIKINKNIYCVSIYKNGLLIIS